MKRTYSRVYAKVDLKAIEYNLEQLHHNLNDDTKMMAVIKADAYGHGAVPVAEALETVDYLWGFAVATADEGVELRLAGIAKPILVLGNIFEDQYEATVKHRLTATVFKRGTAEALSREAVKQGSRLPVHIKIDTGMNRIGYRPGPEALAEIAAMKGLPGLDFEGIYTHFVKADETDKEFSYRQLDRFQQFLEALSGEGISFPLVHSSGSAGTIDLKGGGMSIVRPGIALYGLYPSEEVDKTAVPLKPALELVSQVVYVKEIEKGDTVSYGATFQAQDKMTVATVSIGYGDGYPRALSNKGYVLINGKRAKILGRVCMDQLVVDVSHIPDVTDGSKVTLVGWNGGEHLPVETLSDISGRFNYEFVCDLGKRIPRLYR